MSPKFEKDSLTRYLANEDELSPRRAKHYGHLVDLCRFASTTTSGRPRQTPIRCRKRPQRKACSGQLVVRQRDLPRQIDWHCPQCEAAGQISDWEDTIADLRELVTDQTQHSRVLVGVSPSAHEALRIAARAEPSLVELAFTTEVDEDGDAWLDVPVHRADAFAGELLRQAVPLDGTRQSERLLGLALLIRDAVGAGLYAPDDDGHFELSTDDAADLLQGLLNLPDTSPAEFVRFPTEPASSVISRAAMEHDGRSAQQPSGKRRGRSKRPRTYRIKVALRVVRPPIWRRLLVPSDVSLPDLHELIQAAMGWYNSHLHAFYADGTTYTDPEYGVELGEDSGDVRLHDVLVAKGDHIDYEYDFGDCWEHRITLEEIRDEVCETPRCIKGRRACPPEDCGGPHGYERLLDVLADADHPEHADLREWLGRDPDPEHFDVVSADNWVRKAPLQR